MELLPAKATFAPGEPIVVEARDVGGSVRLLHLDRVVAEAEIEDGTRRRSRRSRRAATASTPTARRPRSTSSQIRSAARVTASSPTMSRTGRSDGVVRERAPLPPERGAVLRLDVPPREADAADRGVRGRARPARVARHRAAARRRGARGRLAADGVRRGVRGRCRGVAGVGGGRALPPRRLAVDARRLPLERRPDERALARALHGRPALDARGRVRRLPPRPVRLAEVGAARRTGRSSISSRRSRR